MNLFKVTFPSPLGEIVLVLQGESVCALDYSDEWPHVERRLLRRFGNLNFKETSSAGAIKKIRAYFEGELDTINTIVVDLGGTTFQERVWKELRKIPAGEAITYGELAIRVGRPGAARAVGTANRLNPAAIVVPCHRVIGSDGALRGYAGGLQRKRWLLDHESKQ